NGQLTPANLTQGVVFYDNAACNWFTYSRVRKYNNFLQKIEEVEMDMEKKEQYKAEVRFLRAYDYMNKWLFFGDVPLITELIPASDKPSRTSSEEVIDFILHELDTVSKVLPEQNMIESGGHITKGASL